MKMSSKFTCRFCKEQFEQPKGLYKHLQSAHSAGSSTDNRTCPICGVLCSKYEGYRDHLLYIHGQSNEGQKLTFKSLNEFLLWKTELEIKYQCKYVLQSAPKVLSSKEKKYFYQCDASSSKAKDKKNLSVVMKQCSSVISVVEGTGVFKVEYWDAHTGHAKPPQMSVENELEAAISSVEMVNAIGESDDSIDKPEEDTAPPETFELKRPVDKQLFFKTQSSKGLNSTSTTLLTPKSKTMQIIPKVSTEKKKSSNMLFSLASVACGKGITKKVNDKVNATKNDAVKTENEKVKTVASPVKNKNGTVTLLSTPKPSAETNTTKTNAEPVNAKSTVTSTDSKSKSTVAKSVSAPKATPSGPQAIAPKITSVTGNAVSPIFTNSAFSNQLVIVNPVGIDPKSNQNISTAPQNIVLQLPLGSSILPACSTSTPDKSAAQKSAVTVATAGSHPSKSKASPGITKTTNNVSKTVGKSAVKPIPNGTSPSSSKTAPVTLASVSTHTTPVSIASSVKNTPIVLSSLPVGSTFMSVNNNLIPIATPSGTFLPTSLPPNIILTPVANSVSHAQSTSTVSSKIVQNQVCFSVAPSSSSVPVVNVQKDSKVSRMPTKNISRTSSSNKTVSSSSPISFTTFKPSKVLSKPKTGAVTKTSSIQKSTPSSIMPILNKFAALGELSITATTVPKNSGIKAKKRLSSTTSSISRSVVKSSAPVYKKTVSTTVNSQTNSKPVKSFPNIAQHLNNPNIGNGTLLFESSGDIFMLEPIDNNEVSNMNLTKSPYTPPKSRVDRSVQTFENLSSAVPRLQRKRTADPDDDAVMMKVKCYQLEMQYLNCKTECKQLKLELTKEKLKNAEFTGEKVDLDNDETNEQSRNKASEIMKEIEDKFSDSKQNHIYTMTKTSVLRSLYDDLEELCLENSNLHQELENYRAHDKFYKSLKKKLYDEDFES